MSKVDVCKKCGNGNRMEGGDFLDTYYEIGCTSCKYKVKAPTKEEAYAEWNEREEAKGSECNGRNPKGGTEEGEAD